jgi:hypothetical protein
MPQFQPAAFGKIHFLQPAVPDTEFRLRFTKAIGDHGEQGLIIGDAGFTLAEQGSKFFTDAEPFPQSFDDQYRPQFDGPQDFQIVRQKTWVSRPGIGLIDNGDVADPSNGFGKTDKAIPVKLVSPAKAVDDPGDGGVVSGSRSLWASWRYSVTVPFLFFRLVERRYIAAHRNSVLSKPYQEKNHMACAHDFSGFFKAKICNTLCLLYYFPSSALWSACNP